MGPAPKRTTVILPESVDAQLTAVAGERGRSDYIVRVLEDRWRDWQEALARLRGAGWSRRQLLAACESLNGVWLWPATEDVTGGALGTQLRDASMFDQQVETHKLDAELWLERISALEKSDAIAAALAFIAREWWTGNRQLEAAIGRLP